MKTRIVLLVAAIAALLLLENESATSQARVGVHIGIPLPAGVVVMNRAPYPGAVWVPGHWVGDQYAGENVWVEGGWIASNPTPVWREREFRHIPHGVAKGWWRKHGGELMRGSYGDRHVEREYR
jgi:hypothetical protein